MAAALGKKRVGESEWKLGCEGVFGVDAGRKWAVILERRDCGPDILMIGRFSTAQGSKAKHGVLIP